MGEKDLTLLDALNVVSFMIGVANYSKNVDQEQMQELFSRSIKNLHQHLKSQDAKLDQIINMLEEVR